MIRARSPGRLLCSAGDPARPPRPSQIPMSAATPSTVLLITHHRDHYVIDRVAAALADRGARPLRLDTDRFPGDLHLSAIDDGDGIRYVVDDGKVEISDREVRAVWTRSLWPPVVAAELEPAYRDACLAQSRAALNGFLDGFPDARWINDFHRVFQAANKIRQLRLARAAGLTVPPTLVTDDPRQVRGFYRRLGGRMVTKLLQPLSMSMDHSGAFMPTSEVGEEDLEHLDSLRYGPMIFQQHLDKAYELRVMVVDGRAFTGAVDAGGSTGSTDWRLAEPGEVGWRHGALPEPVLARLIRLMDALGLVAGAVDLIVTPQGEHVFLEVNPLGEWGMLERDLALPISAAIADALLAEKELR